LPHEIWLIDFKTDRVASGELPNKVKVYEPQLKLYAQALSRIYGRPVSQSWLYFLAARTPVLLPLILAAPKSDEGGPGGGKKARQPELF
jgi:ATP-dependent exoDNAse (exonuclease V) beta subunit